MMWNKVKLWAARNIDPKVVVSTAVGGGLLGAVAFGLRKSGVKPLATAANIAQKGTK